MTDQTVPWDQRRQAGADACWQALYRHGVDVMDTARGGTPSLLAAVAPVLARALADPVRAILDDLPMPLDAEAFERILTATLARTLGGVLWALADAVGDEVARPDPVPFSPPPAGAWVRVRAVGWTQRPEPHWIGAWHVFSGDWKVNDPRRLEVQGRARCGARLTMRSAPMFSGNGCHETVLADVDPGVDACGKCRRLAARSAS